jgi:DnaJ family protein C protein 3
MIVLQSGEYVTMLTRKMAALIFVLTFFDSLVSWVECATQAEIDQHLNLGMQMLTRGQYSDALSHFHAAVDADPNNYMSYYKRATVFLALSRSRPALADLDKVIQLKSDFGKARLQRGSVLLKMGRLDEAHIELEKLLSKDPSNDEATKIYTIIEPLQKAINEVQDFILYKNYQPALDRLTEIVEHIPWDSSIREMRADAYLGAGNTMNAISEMRAMTKLTNDNTEGFFKLSTMHYQLGEGFEGLQQVRECLKLDPEHKDCYPFYKKVKKVAKFLTAAHEAQDSQDWQECITAANKVLKNEPKVNE